MNIPEHVRAYIYSVLSVVGPVAVFYGLLSESEVSLWLGVAGTVLQTGGTVLARANTSRKGWD